MDKIKLLAMLKRLRQPLWIWAVLIAFGMFSISIIGGFIGLWGIWELLGYNEFALKLCVRLLFTSIPMTILAIGLFIVYYLKMEL